MPPTPLVIGLAGGTRSGKTMVANVILNRTGRESIAYIPHNAYYRNISDQPPARREVINSDHPVSLGSELMLAHVQGLRAGAAVELPVYDFTTHSRTARTSHVAPEPIVVGEGILIFADARLRAVFDMKIFVDTDADLHFIRRLKRQMAERGRAAESVVHQYLTTVRPMHLEFVELSKRYADIIVPESARNEVAMEMIVARLEALVSLETRAGNTP